jgi:hypothetical protein
MTRKEEYELAILRVLVTNDRHGRGGMTADEIRKLFHDLIGRNKEEKIFSYMLEHYMVLRMKDSQTLFFPQFKSSD